MLSQKDRLNRLYAIINKSGQKIPFKMNWAQQEFYNSIHSNNIILKARQLGFSTLINLLMLDTAIARPNTSCGIIAHNDESAKELFERNIKFPYDNLPPEIKRAIPVISDSAHLLRLANGSSIRVATSLRSGTLQILHISEFGKICAQFPQRAREVVTGSIETVGKGNITIIESTAEGNDGYFYDYVQTALAIEQSHKKPASSEYKFFFFPWWKEASYSQNEPEIISRPLVDYFYKLESQIGIVLTPEQKNWYAGKRRKLGTDCYREYPSTPEESFSVSMEGAYYTSQLAEARQSGRVGYFPADPRIPINTFWDIGISDYTSIWFHQLVGQQHRFFAYIELCGEPLQYYVSEILKYRDKGYVLGDHYMPWDADIRDKKDLTSYAKLAEQLGLRPVKIVRTNNLLTGIQETRSMLALATFDETGCEAGLKRLAAYRKDWNEHTQSYTDRPLHDESSHAADALRMWAQGFKPPKKIVPLAYQANYAY